MKFKVNDTVKIVCADEVSSTHSTRSKIGQTGMIIKLSGVRFIPYAIYFEAENVTLNFTEEEIEKVSRKGEQLLLFEL